jgi:hypothetical protein
MESSLIVGRWVLWSRVFWREVGMDVALKSSVPDIVSACLSDAHEPSSRVAGAPRNICRRGRLQ